MIVFRVNYPWVFAAVVAGMLLVVTSPRMASAADEESELEDLRAENEDLRERLEALEEGVEMLEDDMEEVLGTQDDLKKSATENRLFWNGSYRITFNKPFLHDNTADFEVQGAKVMGIDDTGNPISAKFGNRVRRGVDAWQQASWVHRLRLMMQYELTENLRFYGRLGVYKYYNEVRTEPAPLDMYANTYPRTAGVNLERVYVDWFVTDWFAITAGRVSSPDGPPVELRENTARRAGWGAQFIEAEVEVAMMTFHLGQLLEGSLIRFFYAPFGTHSPFSLSNPNTLFESTDIKVMHTFGGLVELKIPGLGDNFVQLGFITVPTFRPRNLATTVKGVPEPVWPSAPEGDDLGLYQNFNGLVEFKDIAGTGLDLFGAYVATMLQPGKDRMVYEVPVEGLPLYNANGRSIGNFDGVAEYKIGLSSYEESWRSGEYKPTTNWAHMMYAGFRYTMPWSNYWTRIGGEFNWATKYHISWAAASDLLAAKLGTRGWVIEGYIIQQLVPDFLFVRLGYLHVDRQYNGLYIGPTTRTDIQMRNIYFLLDVAW